MTRIGLWRKDVETREGKYLVQRRDGTVPEWPYFVVGAADPAAPWALMAYAKRAEELGMDPQYVSDLYDLAAEFDAWRKAHGAGNPDGKRHRIDDQATVAKMASKGK
jgi:hypothetical protein